MLIDRLTSDYQDERFLISLPSTAAVIHMHASHGPGPQTEPISQN